MTPGAVTQYASSRRSTSEAIKQQRKILAEYHGSLIKLYNSVVEIILVVNKNRQIIFFNQQAPGLLGFDHPQDLYGLRVGEALGCINACKNPGGCGTSEYCSQCGAVNAILSALQQKNDLKECRVLKENSMEALDLLIKTTPLEAGGQLFSVVAIIDISNQKRRQVLERVFFHDLMNTVTSIKMFAQLIDSNNDIGAHDKNWRSLSAGLQQLISELQSHKELLDAENDQLNIQMKPVDGHQVFKDIAETCKERYHGFNLVYQEPDHKVVFNSDQRILRRVLENMVLNALEASQAAEAVTMSCRMIDGYAEFRVHNQAYIPKEQQLQLFQRSFSTKGRGRGLGTYSMKLLTERYLNGQVSFSSSPHEGTIFVARYPAKGCKVD